MDIQDAVTALAALAQETRLAVYRALVQAGPEGLAAGRIADSLAVPAATLSFHLKELGNAGLITSRQSGRYVIYSANYDEMNALLGYLTEHCCAASGGDCLAVADRPAATHCTPARKKAAAPAPTVRTREVRR